MHFHYYTCTRITKPYSNVYWTTILRLTEAIVGHQVETSTYLTEIEKGFVRKVYA